MTRSWSPAGLIPWFSKTEGNTYATLLHHPFLFGENQRSAQEVAVMPIFHYHCLDILLIMRSSINCSAVICSPTIILAIMREATSETYGPGSILIISISITLLLALFLLCFLLFTLHLSIKNTKNIIYHLY